MSFNERSTSAYETFRRLHYGPDAFVMPNPWDATSALLLARAGFAALGSSSLAIAAVLGRPDGRRALSRDEAIANAAFIGARRPIPSCRSTPSRNRSHACVRQHDARMAALC